MASIYLAEDIQSGKLVAVKQIDRGRRGSRELRERFIREARAIGQVQHEHVIKILDVGQRPDGVPYLVMEFLYGESLGERLARCGKLAPEQALKVLAQATDALWAAHEVGIVHRDLKPDNLYLVGDPDEDFQLKVLDFGLARTWRSELTHAGAVIGSPAYMAPEQVISDPVDQRTDVYALGVVMYRMFTGSAPFDAPDEMALLAKQLLVEPPAPSRFIEDLDPRVELVILTALRKRPELRYPSMQLFRSDILALQDGKAELWAKPTRDEPYVPTNPGLKRDVVDALRQLLADG